ncbi:MAG: hypothetical protein K5886_10405 [Lachnospiraceae bacterium]|nr:hypothetical protein [Lachnospiraceae bacterium]
MTGRYGMDQYNRFLGGAAFFLIVIGFFVKVLLLDAAVLALIGYMYFRVFSKNIPKRYEENRKFLSISGRVTGFMGQKKRMLIDMKTHHIYKCPTCKQKIRVPRGKGRIEISCPKCGTKFIKQS